MKKIFYLIGLVFTVICFSSCQEELENWYSETASYDGRFVVSTTCDEYSSDNTAIADGLELMLYNSAKNEINDIWLDTEVAGLPIKGNFEVTGNSSEFKADEIAKNVSSNTFYMFTPTGSLASFTQANATGYYGAPKSAGILIDGVQLYSRISLLEGKIIPKAATSIGGNTADSVYVKTIIHSDYVNIESYQTPATDWKVPGVAEFAWRVKSGSNTPAPGEDWDEHWTLSGYRYTGMPEDR